jgi:hypothetical protein
LTVPKTLSDRPQWVGYRLEQRGNPPKPTKVPVNPSNGRNAKVDDPTTWATFKKALEAVERYKLNGVGFVFTGGDPFCGVDLDKCLDPQTHEVQPWAAEIVAQLDSYSEVSPSGTGLHIIIGAELPEGKGRKFEQLDERVELYDRGRFFCTTGGHLKGTPSTIEDRQAPLDKLISRLRDGHGKTGRTAGDHRADSYAEGGRHEALLSRAGQMRRTGASQTEIEAALIVFNRERCRPPKPESEVRKLAADIAQRYPAVGGLSAPERPVIRVDGGSLAANVADAERHLAEHTRADPSDGVYQRSGLLVHTARLPEPSANGGIRRAAGTLQIVTATPDTLGLRLAQNIDWHRFLKRESEWILTDVPERVARTLCGAVADWRNTPALSGIVEAPCLRADGSILQASGYDAASGLYFDPGSTRFHRVADSPSREDARAALSKLRAVVSGFPFTAAASRSVALASIITPLIRQAVRSAPLFAISAPKMGSGKTLLGYQPSYIATGRPPALLSQAERPEEEKKRLLAILLGGSVVTAIDNCERPLQSDALCTILTEPTWTERLLGVSRNVSVSTATTWIATGNNLQFSGDLSSRVLLCGIDPECEHPEARRFAVNLHDEIPRRRGELAAAALTIVRAYLVSGASVDVPVFGRFEQWSRFVREPLVWLGCADPCETRAQVESKDPVRESLATLLAAWHETFDSEPQTISTAVTAGSESLRSVMSAIAPTKDGGVNTRRVGRFVAKHERRIERGLCFERAGDRSGGALWRVTERAL